jgi:hypothetical protein
MTYTAYQPIKQVDAVSPSRNQGKIVDFPSTIKQISVEAIALKSCIVNSANPFQATNNKTTSNYKRQPINQITSYLKKEYSINIDEEISDYLQEQPRLIRTLIQILPVTSNYFKGDILHLTILKDSENFTLNKVAIVVNTHRDSDTAFIKLQELDDVCFKARIPNDILVHVEFF